MGIDVGVIAGIGFQAYDLFDKNRQHELSIKYFDDETDEYDFLEEMFEDFKFANYEEKTPMSGDVEHYILVEEPIKGVNDFLNELQAKGFTNITLDDLEFIKVGYMW